MPFLISTLYVSLLALLLILLSFNVAYKRKKLKIGIGYGDDKELSRLIRVQANFVEYVPIAIILLVIYEINSGSHLIVHVMGSLLLVARIQHAYGLSRSVGASLGRVFGTSITWLVIIVLACINIYQFIVQAIN